jgi:hypothetical protein
MMKNCGDVVHGQVAEMVLPDLVKFVKKKVSHELLGSSVIMLFPNMSRIIA